MKVISKTELENWIQDTTAQATQSQLYYQAKIQVLQDQLAYLEEEGKPLPQQEGVDVTPELKEEEKNDKPEPIEGKDAEVVKDPPKFEEGEQIGKEDMAKLQENKGGVQKTAEPSEDDLVYNHKTDKWEPRAKVEKELEEEDKFGK